MLSALRAARGDMQADAECKSTVSSGTRATQGQRGSDAVLPHLILHFDRIGIFGESMSVCLKLAAQLLKSHSFPATEDFALLASSSRRSRRVDVVGDYIDTLGKEDVNGRSRGREIRLLRLE